MNIAIIGSGNVGLALAKGLGKTSHNVYLGVRDQQSAKAIHAKQVLGNVPVLAISDACKNAEVIIITTPADSVVALIPYLGNVSGKVIIDATNSIRTKPEPYQTAFHAMVGLTTNAEIVKCFNSTGFENMTNPIYNDMGLDMFCAGNSLKAKQVAIQLSKEIGFENCYDFGGDDKVELLEKFALSWINLAIMQGLGRNIAFKVIKRN
ncbi:MAG: NAD(P)-binding domain-containing protein [Bacteroidetes bacterium]|nr:NAD(P)-binding domain-containing protein [Bacteroidota bacterium]